MTLRRLSVLQWFGLVGAALLWAGQQVVGFGIGQADCSAAGRHWGIAYDTWELALLVCAGSLVVLAEVAAVVVFKRTRGVGNEDHRSNCAIDTIKPASAAMRQICEQHRRLV